MAKTRSKDDTSMRRKLLGQKKYDEAQAAAQTPETKPTVPVQEEGLPRLPKPQVSKPKPSSIDPSLVKDVMATQERQEGQANKENISAPQRRFIDRQKSAKRVSPESDSHDEDHSPQFKRQKSIVEEEEDDDDDDAFETTTAPRRDANRGRSKHSIASKRPAKATGRRQPRHFLTDNQDQGLPPDVSDDASSSPSSSSSRSRVPTAAQRVHASSGAEEPSASSASRSTADVSSASPRLTQIERLQHTKNIARSRPPPKAKTTQVRRPYTIEQEARLVTLVEEYGKNYSELLKLDDQHEDGALLQDRTQVQIKDKLENIKFQFLKSEVPLPNNFEDIPLKKVSRELLAAMGIVEGY